MGEFGLGAGWWLLEISMRVEGGTGLAKLYPDYGDGMSDEASIQIPLANWRMVKRVIHFPTRPRALRFDPLEGRGVFAIEWMRFVPLTSAFAIDRMKQRVRYLDPSADLGDGLEEAYDRTFDPNGLERSYRNWIVEEEEPEWQRLDRDAPAIVEGLAHRPLISVVLPVYETAPSLLREAIESVRAQSYPDWELCIADDASPSPHVREILAEYSELDDRIRVAHRETNGHISAASNSALSMATGSHVAFLDHDDRLSRHALLFAARALDERPDATLVYSDEDKMDVAGYRHQPHFKSGWNPDLLLAQNYICHLAVMSRDRVVEVGGLREGYEGSQDHDLLLRVTRGASSESVVHIPKILYHWRVIDGSTAASAGAKSYSWDAGVKAVAQAACARSNDHASVEAGALPHTYRVRWDIPDPAPRVSLIVPTRDGLDILSTCVDSVLSKTTYETFELVIVDNQSVERETLAYFDEISKDPRVRVIPYDRPFNFSAINNHAVRETEGEVVVLLNNDVEVIEGEWLTELVSHAVRDEIGCVGAKLHYPDGRIQHGGVILGIGGVAGHAHKYYPEEHPGYFGRLHLVQNLSAVTAACLAVRRSIYEEVGGLDEENLAVAFNDVDFCLKVRDRGYRNLYTPYARLYHHESVSRGDDHRPDKVERFHAERDHMVATWGHSLHRDPYYNPNLSLTREDFGLR